MGKGVYTTGEMKTGHHNVESASPDRYGQLKDFARNNRVLPPDAEYVLWRCLRQSQLGVRFRRQHPIGDYIVDFVCISENLVIEVDGGYHSELVQKQKDIFRQEKLEEMGYRVLRFSNEQVLFDIDGVLKQISECIN